MEANRDAGRAERTSDGDTLADDYLGEIPYRATAEGLLLEALRAPVERVLELGTADERLSGLLRSAYPECEVLALDVSRPLPEAGTFDAVVSALALHQLEEAPKRALFAEVCDRLRRGGVFANLDFVRTASPELHESLWRETGMAEDEPLAGVCEQLEWLRDAGFGAVDCAFKWMHVALVVAVR